MRGSDIDHLRWLARFGLGAWKDQRVLDLGCGSGELCRLAAEGGARAVVGVDLEPPSAAPIHWRFMTVDLEGDTWPADLAPQFPDARVDRILAFDILEHLTAPARFLAACAGLLAPGGSLVLTTPNTASWERLARGARWSGATDPQHKVLFSPYSLRFLLERSGFHTVALTARMRALEALGPLSPPIGAQICAHARPIPLT